MASLGSTHVGNSSVGNIFAGVHGSMQVTDIILASGQGVLTEGTLLGKITATGKYLKQDDGSTDGSEFVAGVLGCDVDATSEANAFMYTHGEFNATYLTAGQAIVAGSFGYGSIVIKEEV